MFYSILQRRDRDQDRQDEADAELEAAREADSFSFGPRQVQSNTRGNAVKAYPLEIENVGGDTYIVMSRGHHDVHEFMREVRKDYSWPLGMPEHVWMRAVPTRDPSYNYLYARAEPNARGAFPCTYSWEAYNEDSYESIVAKTGVSKLAPPAK